MELLNDRTKTGSMSKTPQQATNATSRAYIPADDIPDMRQEALLQLKVLNDERPISEEEWEFIETFIDVNWDDVPGIPPRYLNMPKAKEALMRRRGQEAQKAYLARISQPSAGIGTMQWFLSNLEARGRQKKYVKITSHKNHIREYLEAAYSRRVANDNLSLVTSPDLTYQINKVSGWMTEPEPGDNSKQFAGLLIRGGVGVGKSTMMRAISDVFAVVENKAVMEVSANEVCVAYTSDKARFKELCSAPMLSIDDMGVEPATVLLYGNPVSPMVELIDERYRRLMFTVITTNLTEDKIRDTYGPRTHDRLKQLCGWLKYSGEIKSYRQ